MIGTIITLLTHDVAVALRNKTIFLVVCVPLFIYVTLTVVDSTDGKVDRIKLALLQDGSYEPVVLESLKLVPDQFALRWALNEEDAMRLLREREVDGVLARAGSNEQRAWIGPSTDSTGSQQAGSGSALRSEGQGGGLLQEPGVAPSELCRSRGREGEEGGDSRLTLIVVQEASVKTLAILQQLSALQLAVEGDGAGWVASVRSLQTSSVKRQTLPTWILMMVLLVAFIVLPTQVAEEKEKQLLLGWMQTPVREREWLIAKLVYGVVLILVSVVTLQIMGSDAYCAHGLSYLAMLCAGGFSFGAMGICLGLLCRNQAAARTFGVLCYLPLLLPAALSDMSQKMRSIAPLVPSYHFYEPIRAMILDDSGMRPFSKEWVILVTIGLLACLASHRLLKKRWLM